MTTEEQQQVERLRAKRLDGSLEDGILMVEAADTITRLVEERDEARRTIAACAAALPNGAFIDAERASLKFMAHLPGEISAVCQGLSRASEAKVAELQEALKKMHRRAQSAEGRADAAEFTLASWQRHPVIGTTAGYLAGVVIRDARKALARRALEASK